MNSKRWKILPVHEETPRTGIKTGKNIVTGGKFQPRDRRR